MRRSGFVLLALLMASATGCFSAQPERAIARFEAFNPFAGPQGEDVVQIDVAIIERTVGDGYINKDLWQLSDEAVDPELKPILQKNGFRACQLGTTPTSGLLDLLRSEKSCVNPQRIRLHAGNPKSIPLGSIWSSCQYDLDKANVQIPVEFAKAQCMLTVTPTLTDDGGITLQFTPEVRYGTPTLKARPVQEPSGAKSWMMSAEQEGEAYTWLSWKMTVKPDEFVVVGTLLDRPESLGYRCFLFTETNTPVQRLLVIRPSRAVHEKSYLEEAEQRILPLAVQAQGR